MSDGRLDLSVQYAVPRRGLPHRIRLARWIEAALARPVRLTVRFVGVREGRALNRDYRHRDYATNVLTFAYGSHGGGRSAPLAGDLVLCAPVVAREARAQAKPLDAHYAHLVVHGTLHVLGWTHERDDDAARMELRETRILARLGYPDPYAAGSLPP
jgi:probable rRNA maturation factor